MLLAPSLLAADFSALGAELESADSAGADFLHLDIMDGVFVDNISFGLPIVAALRPITALPFDVHLMISDPLPYIRKFAAAGADIITFHYEQYAENPELANNAIDAILECGKLPSMAVNPDTPADMLLPFLPRLHMALVMTVQPGYGGQPLLTRTLPKLNFLRGIREKYGYNYLIQADGGINESNISDFAARGADIVVAGSAFFRALDRHKAARALKF